MKSIAFAATIAALTLSALAFSANVALATEVIEIKGKYSKIKLDGICSAQGGESYSQSGGGYGCTKGGNTVECDQKGNCKGYVPLKSMPAGTTKLKPTQVLQMPATPVTPDTTGSAIGGAATGGAVVAP